MLAGAYAARDFGFEPWTVAGAGRRGFRHSRSHRQLAFCAGRAAWLSPLAYIFRDLLFAVIWIDGWLGDDFVWLGNSMTVREASEETVDAA